MAIHGCASEIIVLVTYDRAVIWQRGQEGLVAQTVWKLECQNIPILDSEVSLLVRNVIF